MKQILLVLGFVLVSLSSQAALVSTKGTLSDGSIFTGTVADEDDSLAASLGDYWTFEGMTGDLIDIDINRTEAEPDLIAVLFFGDVSGVDMDLFSPDGLVNGILVSSGTFGPLSVVDFADDTEDDTFGGPFGDPRFSLTLTDTGTFSLLVASLNVGGDYEIITSGIGAAVVPEPTSLALLGLGLLGLGARRRVN